MCLRVLIGHSIICRVFVFDLNLKTRTLKTVKYTGKLHEKIMNYFFMVLKADYSSPYFFFCYYVRMYIICDKNRSIFSLCEQNRFIDCQAVCTTLSQRHTRLYL